MDLLSLVMLCSPLVDSATALRVIAVESGGRPFVVHDNSDGRAYDSVNLSDGVRAATALIRAGHSVDMGLMQINYQTWLRPTGFSLEMALDPCTNVRLGTTILSGIYTRMLRSHRSPREALWRSLSVYNSGSESKAIAYANQVLTGRIPRQFARHSGSP